MSNLRWLMALSMAATALAAPDAQALLRQSDAVRNGWPSYVVRVKITNFEAAKPDEEDLDISAFAGVHQFPARIKCATLGWHAAINALHGESVTASTE